MPEISDLEREALAIWKQYSFFLPASVKAFFRRLAASLNWHDLTKVIEK